MAGESKLQTKIVKEFAEHSIMVLKFTSPAHRGVPDLVAFKGDRTVWIEVKNPNGRGRLSRLQEVTHHKMRSHGARVYVCETIQQARAVRLAEFDT